MRIGSSTRVQGVVSEALPINVCGALTVLAPPSHRLTEGWDINESTGVDLDALPTNVLGAIMSQCDARSLCTLSLCCRALAAAAAEEEPLLYRALVTQRYGPLEWALPPGALKPSGAGGWRALYYRLGKRRSAGHWGSLAVGFVTHDQLVALGHSRPCNWSGCLLLIDDAIHDVSRFAPLHPGMAASLHLFAGTDASEPFGDVSHSPDAVGIMATLCVPALSLAPEGHPASLLSDEQYAAWRRRERGGAAGGGESGHLLPRRLADALPAAGSLSRLLSSERWREAVRRASASVLEMLRAPADGSATGHRRHDALYAAGLYAGRPTGQGTAHVDGAAVGQPGGEPVRWWMPYAPSAAWQGFVEADGGWW